MIKSLKQSNNFIKRQRRQNQDVFYDTMGHNVSRRAGMNHYELNLFASSQLFQFAYHIHYFSNMLLPFLST